MVATKMISVSEGDNILLVGTMKGAFLLRPDNHGATGNWEVRISLERQCLQWHMITAMAATGFGRRPIACTGAQF